MTALSILIPANNEQDWIVPCLEALLSQPADPRLDGQGEDGAPRTEIIVAANACTDDTVAIARAHAPQAKARGWRLVALDIPKGGKINALNHAEAAAGGGVLVYLDADVICRPGVIAAIHAALDRPDPAYASGQIEVARARTWITRRYADLWTRLPFVKAGAVGAGLFAMNRVGRGRWGVWPQIISDDTFARLHFTEDERHETPGIYVWPMVEGFANLVRVRRRQNAGVIEVREKFPGLIANETHGGLRARGMLRLFAEAPLSFCVYVSVALAVRFSDGPLSAPDRGWSRGR